MSAEDFRTFFRPGCLMASCTFGAASRTSQTRSRTNKRFWGSTWPACMKPRVFLATPAGVRVVYQSALVVHEVAQVSARTGQELAKVVGSDLQELSGNGVAYTRRWHRGIKVKRCSRSRQRSIPEVQEDHCLGHQQGPCPAMRFLDRPALILACCPAPRRKRQNPMTHARRAPRFILSTC